MKTIIIIFIILITANAEINNAMMEDALISGFTRAGEGVVKAGGSILRRATNTRTEKEKCQSRETKLRAKESKHWWDIWKENNKLIKILIKHEINYSLMLKQTKVKKINLEEIKIKSCSESYFNYAVQRKKANNKIENKNRIIKELISLNGLSIQTKSLYEQTQVEKKKEYKKINMTITENKDMKQEMKQEMKEAIKDVD